MRYPIFQLDGKGEAADTEGMFEGEINGSMDGVANEFTVNNNLLFSRNDTFEADVVVDPSAQNVSPSRADSDVSKSMKHSTSIDSDVRLH